MFSFLYIPFLILATWNTCVPAQLINPTFPDVFSTFVEFDSLNAKRESNVEVYFDRKNNKAAMHLFTENEMFIQIFRFDTDTVIKIEDQIKCKVEPISSNPDELFFPYEIDDQTKVKKLLSARKFFRFPSKPPKPRLSVQSRIQMLVYEVTQNLPFWGVQDCEIEYMFSTKDFSMADCYTDTCNSTIMRISIDCPSFSSGGENITMLLRFFKFQNHIPDETVFEIPPGVHCDLHGTKAFPELPRTFSVFYDVKKREFDIEDQLMKTQVNRMSVTYVFNETFAVDKFEESVLSWRSVCDLSYGIGYVINARTMECKNEPCISEFSYRKGSLLPNILFPCENCDKEKPVYVGNRSSENLYYEVWSSKETTASSLHIVRDMYFTQNLLGTVVESPSNRLSHIIEYVYDKNSETSNYELLEKTYTSMSHYSFTRDWAAFDLSVCYSAKQKRKFEIQFSESSSIVVGSLLYKKIIQALTGALLSVTDLPTTRFTELKPLPGSVNLTLRGEILEDPDKLGWTKRQETNRSMDEAFTTIKNLVDKGSFIFFVPTDSDKLSYTVTTFREPPQDQDISPDNDSPETFYTQGAMAGLGIAMSFIGALIGGISALIYMKSRSK